MLLRTTLPVLLLLNWASIKHAKPSFFPHTFAHDAFFTATPFQNERYLFLSPSPNFSSRASSFLCTHSNFVSRFLSTHANFVWSLDSTSAMFDVNSWPWKSMSSLAHIWANIKENNLNHNIIKRSQQRNNQPVIRAAFCRLEWEGEKEDLAESRETFVVAAAQFSVLTRDTAFCFRVWASVYW